MYVNILIFQGWNDKKVNSNDLHIISSWFSDNDQTMLVENKKIQNKTTYYLNLGLIFMVDSL